MALLHIGQLHVEFLEAAFGSGAADLQLFQQRIDFFQVGTDLGAARTHLFGLLLQAQLLHL